MATLTDHLRAGAFLVSESNGMLSRDQVTLISGQNLKAGTVLKASSSKVTQATAGATAVGILFADVDASAGDKQCTVVNFNAEVRGSDLIYPAENTAGTVVSGLNTSLGLLGIKVR